MITTKRQERNNRYGFALVELLVAISIIVILSISLLFQQSKFDSSVQIANVAYEVATVIQKAQRYGASSVAGTFSDTDVGYGVYFNRGSQAVILFRDTDDNKNYNSGDSDVEEYTISGKTEVFEIRNSGGNSVSEISIVFVRPDPEPSTSAQIIIENDGETRTIEVSQTGQVQVKNN